MEFTVADEIGGSGITAVESSGSKSAAAAGKTLSMASKSMAKMV